MAMEQLAPVAGAMADCPGVYYLRSGETDWDEETLWRTYATSPTSRQCPLAEGLRPVYHRRQACAEGHLLSPSSPTSKCRCFLRQGNRI